jgi:hypothetical protein
MVSQGHLIMYRNEKGMRGDWEGFEKGLRKEWEMVADCTGKR